MPFFLSGVSLSRVVCLHKVLRAEWDTYGKHKQSSRNQIPKRHAQAREVSCWPELLLNGYLRYLYQKGTSLTPLLGLLSTSAIDPRSGVTYLQSLP